MPWPRQDTDYELPKPTSALLLSLDRVAFTTYVSLLLTVIKTGSGLSMTQAALQTTATSHCHQRASAWTAWWSVDHDKVTCRSTSVRSRVRRWTFNNRMIELRRLRRILTRHSARHRTGMGLDRIREQTSKERVARYATIKALREVRIGQIPHATNCYVKSFRLTTCYGQGLTPAASPFSNTFSASTCILPLLPSFLHRASLRATLNDRTIMLTVAQL